MYMHEHIWGIFLHWNVEKPSTSSYRVVSDANHIAAAPKQTVPNVQKCCENTVELDIALLELNMILEKQHHQVLTKNHANQLHTSLCNNGVPWCPTISRWSFMETIIGKNHQRPRLFCGLQQTTNWLSFSRLQGFFLGAIGIWSRCDFYHWTIFNCLTICCMVGWIQSHFRYQSIDRSNHFCLDHFPFNSGPGETCSSVSFVAVSGGLWWSLVSWRFLYAMSFWKNIMTINIINQGSRFLWLVFLLNAYII